MKRFNRLWALLLAFALMITYMPAMAFAEGDMASKSVEDASISFDEDNPNEIWSDDEYDFTYTTDGLDDVEGYRIEYSVSADNELWGPVEISDGWTPLEDGRAGVHIDGADLWAAAKNVNDNEEVTSCYILFKAEVFLGDELLCSDNEGWTEIKTAGEEEPVKFSVIDTDTEGTPDVEALSAGDSVTVRCTMQRRSADTHEWAPIEGATYDFNATGSLSVTKDGADVFTIQRTSNEEGSVEFYASYPDSAGETASATAEFYVWDGSGDDPEGETVTVTYNANGGFFKAYDEDDNLVNIGEVYKTTCEAGDYPDLDWASLERPGYEFEYWSEEPDGEEYTGGAPYEDTTYYAVWTETDAVIFDANGGKFIDANGNEVTEITVEADGEGEVYEPEDPPVHDEKAFDGWYWDKECRNPVEYEIDGIITLEENSGHTKVYAKWAAAYTATFDAGNGGYFDGDKLKTTKSLKFKKNSVIDWDYVEYEISMSLTETGRNIFRLWKYNGQAVDVYEDFVMNSNKTFTADYETGYLLTFNANGKKFDLDDGSEGEEELVTAVYKNSTVSESTWGISGSTDGMVLMGWALEPDSEELINTDTYIIKKDTVLYAVWGNKLNIELDPNGGVFIDVWGDESTERQSVDSAQGQTLDIFTTATDESGHEIFSFNYDQTPEKENNAFCGWFYDSACTDPVEKGTIITADLINNHEGTLTLYAGYTADYKEVILDANGGTFGASGTKQLTLKVPEGLAVDVTSYNPYKDNDDDERMELSGWYYSKNCSQTSRVEMIDDKLFIPTESGRTLFARWLEPIDRDYINLKLKKSSGALYSDNTAFSVTASLTSEKYDMSEFTPIYEFELGVYDDEDFVPFINSTEHKYYTASGNKITINGAVIREAFEDEYIEDEQLYLFATAYDKTTGRELKKNAVMISLFDPYTYLDFVNTHDNNETLIGYTLCITSKGEGTEYSAKSPSGRNFNYTITKIELAGNGDGPFKKVEDIGGEFDLTTQKLGKEKVTVYYKDPGYIKTQKKVITLEVVKDSFGELGIVQVSEPNTDGQIVKGMSLSFKAEAEQDTAEGYEPGPYTIEWGIADDRLLSLDVDESTGIATVTFNEEAEFDPDEYNETVLTATLKDENGESRRTDDYTLRPCEQFYTVANLPVIDDYLAINQYLEFNPTVTRFAADTGMEGEAVTDPTFAIEYDGEFSLFDMEGNAIGNAERFNGPFKIKRLSGDCFYVGIYVIDEYDNSAGYEGYYIPELLDLREDGAIKAIPDKPYTKGQIKPTIVVTYGGKKLKLNTDYTVTYGTNKNVGTGKVTVKGKGRYCGSISKTFKINPKGTKLSKLTASQKAFTVTWTKQATQTTGYEIQYGLKKNFKGAKTLQVKKNKTTKATIKKLKGGKTYYVRIRTYKKIGKTYYRSAWSSAKKIKVKR